MAEQLPADARDEGDRHEHRQQHEGDGENRAGDLGHRFLASFRHRERRFFLDDPLDVLDHDDGVVDDDADGKHQRQQGDGVGRIADEQQHGEGADDRHRYRDQRDQRGPHLTEKQEHHDADENDGDDEGAHHFDDGRGHEYGCIEKYVIGEIGREARRQRIHGVAHLLGHIDGVGARRLVDADRGGGRAVVAAVTILRSGAHFDARHVVDPDHRAIGIGAQNDAGELLGPRQPALGLDIDLKLLLACSRRCADTAERRLNVLVLHGGNDVVRRQIEFGQPIGIKPNAQRIIERPEQGDLADALDPRQRVNDIDGRVIAQIDGVEGVLRRINIDDLKQGCGFLADRDTGA